MNIEYIVDRLKKIVGPDKVSTNPIDKITYTSNLLWLYGGSEPDVIVRPVSNPMGNNPIPRILSFANKHKIPVVCKGGVGVGASNCHEGGILIDMLGMNKILEINRDRRHIVVEAGASMYNIHRELFKQNMHIPIYGTYESGTIAVSAFTNFAEGFGSTKYGYMQDHVTGLEVALPDGDIIKFGALSNEHTDFGPFMRYVNGPDFVGAFVNAYGNYGVITRLSFRTIDFKREWLHDYCFCWRRDQIEQFQQAMIEQGRTGIYDIHFNDRPGFEWELKEGKLTEVPEDAWFFLLTQIFARNSKEREGKEETMREIYESNGGVEVKEIAEKHMGAGAQKHGLAGWPYYHSVGLNGYSAELVGHGGTAGTSSKYYPLDCFKEMYEFEDWALKEAGLHDEEKYTVTRDSYICADQNMKEETFVWFNPYNREDFEKIGKWLSLVMMHYAKKGTCFHGTNLPNVPRYAWEKLGPVYDLIKKIKREIDPHNILNPGAIM